MDRGRSRPGPQGHRVDPGLLAAINRHHGVFATADALACGLDRNALGTLVRTGQLRRIRYGVLTTTGTWNRHAAEGRTHHLACAAVIRRLRRPQSVVSHTSAARLHGLILPREADADVWLTDPEQYRTGRGYRVLEAPLPVADVTVLGGLRVTSLTRTLADVGRSWPVTDTVVAADDVLADGRTTRAALSAAALDQTHWVGAGRSARALALARVGAHSPHETRSRLALVAAGLPEPVLQAAVLRGERLVAVLDMYWEGTAVFAECDGMVKYTDPWGMRSPADVAWAEKARHDDLLDLDLRGVRLRPADLHEPLAHKVRRIGDLLATPTAARGCRIIRWNEGLRREPRVADAG